MVMEMEIKIVMEMEMVMEMAMVRAMAMIYIISVPPNNQHCGHTTACLALWFAASSKALQWIEICCQNHPDQIATCWVKSLMFTE